MPPVTRAASAGEYHDAEEFSSGTSGDEYEPEEDESEQSSEDDEDEETDLRRGASPRVAPSAEIRIESDFDRLVASIRQGSTSEVLGTGWDINLEEKESEFLDDLREASGVGRQKRKKGRRRTGPVLSQQVRALIGEGNQAYVDGNMQETIRIMQEVIRIEPRAGSAWSVLAQCHNDIGESQKALQLRIMAAHLHHDAEEWQELAKYSEELGYNQQALYCYGKLCSLDPENVSAFWDRATLAKEIGELNIARNTLLAILKRLPHNLTVLDELRPILIELNELPLCATIFADAFEYFHTTFTSGMGLDEETSEEVPGGGFGLMHLYVLADLHNTAGEYESAVHTIRRGCRWLQGRAAQKFWDVCEDDREYDPSEGVRGPEGELQPGMYPLDVNARHRLAIARIKNDDMEEGKLHAQVILSHDVAEYAPLFVEIADAYFERDMYHDASRIYEILGGDAGTSSLYVLLQAAACRRMMGDIKEAAEVYQHVIAADPTHNDAKMKLAEIYEILNEPRKALDLVLQVVDSRKRRRREAGAGDAPAGEATTSLFSEKVRTKGKAPKPGKLTKTQLIELESAKEHEVARGYQRLQGLWPAMLTGEEMAEREWLIEAEKLVEAFRETRPLFLTTRQHGFRGMFPRSRRKRAVENEEADEEDIASRLQLELGNDSLAKKLKSGDLDSFRTVHFDDWLRLFMHYTFLLTKKGEHEQANEVLRHISYSNAYQTRSSQDTIRLAIITCAIHAGQYPTAVEQSRKLLNAHQFNNEPFRILVASLSRGLRATDAFLVSTLSKHLLRELKTLDAAVKNPDALKWNATLRRYGPGGVKAEEDEEGEDGGVQEDGREGRLPTKENPVGVAVYGQICLAAKSYQSALFYLLHAYDYCPDDPLISLCLAVASIGRAMQRQSDNRHHLITQGIAFLTRYRTLRGHDAVGQDEVEFNFGRAFQQLGLHSLAVKHYEKVLEMIETRLKVDDQDFGVAREAAYNLSLIYVTSGATALAQALYRKWLSL